MVGRISKHLFWGLLALTVLAPFSALAGVIELGGDFSFNKTTFAKDSYTFTRRFTASFTYHLTQSSALEFDAENAVTRNKIPGSEDSTYRDKVYSASWVQSFFHQSPFQPFLKAGAGQLYRKIEGTYASGATPPESVDTLTVILGFGLKLYILDHFIIRGQVQSYLDGGHIRTYKDNIATSIGLSIFF